MTTLSSSTETVSAQPLLLDQSRQSAIFRVIVVPLFSGSSCRHIVSTLRTSRLRNKIGPSHSSRSASARAAVSGRSELAMASS